ncbi:MAG: preprotein translocase subunit SecE [Actinomycetota bacterium]
MAMNRETRRLLQKQGELGPDGSQKPQGRQPRSNTKPAQQERTSPAQYAREVRAELKKVMWPTRSETMHYSVVVLITIIVLTAMIAGLDFVLGEGVLQLFDV